MWPNESIWVETLSLMNSALLTHAVLSELSSWLVTKSISFWVFSPSGVRKEMISPSVSLELVAAAVVGETEVVNLPFLDP
jgi:hypothetical protein